MNNVVCFTDESITVQDAIKSLQMAIDGHETRTAIYNLAIQALQEKQERENPRTLTLDELREMDGEPVWVELDDMGMWRIVEIVPNYNSTRLYSVHNTISAEHAIRDGNVYRYPPKEER